MEQMYVSAIMILIRIAQRSVWTIAHRNLTYFTCEDGNLECYELCIPIAAAQLYVWLNL